MRRRLWSLGLATVLLGPAAAQPPLPAALTLAEALDRAGARNPTLAAARREVDAADAALRQAGARRNPTLTASVEDTRPETRVTTATLDFSLDIGGQRAARVEAAERGRALAQVELEQARAELRAAVTAAYYTVLVAQERSRLGLDAAALAARAADAVGQRVKAGKVSPVDETRARVDEANARLESAEAAVELDSARQTLAGFWDDPAPDFRVVAGDLQQVPTRPPTPELLQALDASPALAARRLEVARRRSLVEVERSKGAPDLTLSVGTRRDNALGRTQAVVGLSVPLPFFDRNLGAVGEAGHRAAQADDELRAARARAATELQQAAQRLALARTTAEALRSAVLPAAQSAYDAATLGFQAGKFGFLDVIDAQRSLLQARSRFLTALATAQQAATAIDRLLGR